MKQILNLIIVIVLGLSLTACGKPEVDKDDKVNEIAQDGEVGKDTEVTTSPTPTAEVTKDAPTATPTPEGSTLPVAKKLKKFSNDDIGVSFEYPEEWGEVTLKFESGYPYDEENDEMYEERCEVSAFPCGEKYVGTFSNASLIFGGINRLYTYPIGADFLFCFGYYFQDGKYYYSYVKKNEYKTNPDVRYFIEEMNNQNNVKILLAREFFDHNDFTWEPEPNDIGAVVNISGKKFPAINFHTRTAMSKEELKKVLNTLEILK